MAGVPLKILITDGSLLDDPSLAEQVTKLQAAGHDIAIAETWLKAYDFIVGPNCWLLRPEVANLFTLAVTNARKIANADQKRIDAHTAAKASKRPAGKPRKVASRKSKVTKPVAAAQHTIYTGTGQLDLTTDIEADSFGAGV